MDCDQKDPNPTDLSNFIMVSGGMVSYVEDAGAIFCQLFEVEG